MLDLTDYSSSVVVPDLNSSDFFEGFMPINTGWTFPSDPAGIGSASGSTSPSQDPNATGGWASAILGLGRMALSAFQTYENGSTAAATPKQIKPANTIQAPAINLGGTSISISTILFVVAGVIVGGVLIHTISH